MTTLLAILAVGTLTTTPADWAASCGLSIAELNLPEGKLQVYLPAHVAPGDMISGTAFAFAGGDSALARNANLAALQARELTVGDRTIKVSEALFHVQIPSDATTFDIVSRHEEGATARATVQVRPLGTTYTGMVASPIIEEGYAIRVLGPFDGKRESTMVKLDGVEAGILAESPRECVVSAMGRGPGSHRVEVTEGSAHLDQRINIARLTVTPPEEARIGKKSYIEVMVDGLDDPDPRAFPLHIVLRSTTPTLLSFGEGASIEVTQDGIRDGVWKGKLEFKTKKRGTYELFPQLIATGFLDRISTTR